MVLLADKHNLTHTREEGRAKRDTKQTRESAAQKDTTTRK